MDRDERIRVIVQFDKMLCAFERDLVLDKNADLFDVLLQLDMIAQAFEMIKDDAELKYELCESAYLTLADLNFLPGLRESHAPNTAHLAKDAERFGLLNPALQEMTFDVVMAISKICKALNQVLLTDENLLYDTTMEGNRRRNEVKQRREH